MATYDLVIRGGTVVDGTGLPRRAADVAVSEGRVAAIGDVTGAGRRELRADGLVVAPGIVDPHTHYDPQLTFEPYATSSCFHGVTTVLSGNCGFSVAPLRPGDSDWLINLFAKVEGMDPDALGGIPYDRFETFAEYLDVLDGNLGINAAFYVGHCAVRRYVMGDASQEREATSDEVAEMAGIVRAAVRAGAAGFSSTHSPTHIDLAGRPAPSRLSSYEELLALASASAGAGSLGYLPASMMEGLSGRDGDLLIELAQSSASPVVIQGLGAMSKLDAPTAAWGMALDFIARAEAAAAPVYSMMMSRPFNRRFDMAGGTSVFEGVPQLHRIFSEAGTVDERMRMASDESYRDLVRRTVDHPNDDPQAGPVVPPPEWAALSVAAAGSARPEVGRTLADIAAERGVHPVDVMLDLAIDEKMDLELLWHTESDEWRERAGEAQANPHMLVGTTDAGAHLDRDDGSEATSYFLQRWVREWGAFTLEEGIRQITAVPAAIIGLPGRGTLEVGSAADVMIFDPDTVGPGTKERVADFPGGASRWASRPKGFRATIVNGVPIVLEGELQEDAGLPGTLLRPRRS